MRHNRKYTPIGRRIAQLARNQAEISQVLGLTQQSVSGKLTGKIAVNLQDIDKLAAHYSVPAAWFLVEGDSVDPKALAAVLLLVAGSASVRQTLKILADLPADYQDHLYDLAIATRETVRRVNLAPADLTDPQHYHDHVHQAAGGA